MLQLLTGQAVKHRLPGRSKMVVGCKEGKLIGCVFGDGQSLEGAEV